MTLGVGNKTITVGDLLNINVDNDDKLWRFLLVTERTNSLSRHRNDRVNGRSACYLSALHEGRADPHTQAINSKAEPQTDFKDDADT